jgi:hypothetical protein
MVAVAFLMDAHLSHRRRDAAWAGLFAGLASADQQDGFFVPFAGFDGVRRPGPNFRLYKNIGAP